MTVQFLMARIKSLQTQLTRLRDEKSKLKVELDRQCEITLDLSAENFAQKMENSRQKGIIEGLLKDIEEQERKRKFLNNQERKIQFEIDPSNIAKKIIEMNANDVAARDKDRVIENLRRRVQLRDAEIVALKEDKERMSSAIDHRNKQIEKRDKKIGELEERIKKIIRTLTGVES